MKVLFAGRLVYFKDPITFIKTSKLLPEHTFIVAGDGPLLPKCQEMAGENVIFKGWVDSEEVRELRKETQVFCQLSPIENIWAGTLIEALKVYSAVVCTDVGYTRRYLTDRYHVLLVPPREPKAVAEAIKQLEDPELRDFLGRNGRDYVRNNLSIESITDQILEVVKSVC